MNKNNTNLANGPQRSTSKPLRNPVIPVNQTWRCVECKFVLGYTNPEKTELRVKFKDQYITITNAEKVECACRRCAKFNSVAALTA